MARSKKRIEWSHEARSDLLEVVAYLRSSSPAAADRFLDRLDRRLLLLRLFAESGRRIPEDPDSGDREVIVMRWRVAYRIEATAIRILFVIHGARQFPPAR